MAFIVFTMIRMYVKGLAYTTGIDQLLNNVQLVFDLFGNLGLPMPHHNEPIKGSNTKKSLLFTY